MSPLLPSTLAELRRVRRPNCHTWLPSRPVALLFALDPRSPTQPKPSLRRTHRSLPELASHPTANGRPRSIIRSSRAVIRTADSTEVEHPIWLSTLRLLSCLPALRMREGLAHAPSTGPRRHVAGDPSRARGSRGPASSPTHGSRSCVTWSRISLFGSPWGAPNRSSPRSCRARFACSSHTRRHDELGHQAWPSSKLEESAAARENELPDRRGWLSGGDPGPF
jgi:hypothetical protein